MKEKRREEKRKIAVVSPQNNQSREPIYLLIETLGKRIEQVSETQEDLQRFVMESIKEYVTREQIERVKDDVTHIRAQVERATKNILDKMDTISKQQANQQLNDYKALAARQTTVLGVIFTTILGAVLTQIFPSFFAGLTHLFRP